MTQSPGSRWVPCLAALLATLAIGGCGLRGVGRVCGGETDDACLPGLFCKSDAGACNDSQAAGACAFAPTICDLSFSPVCGCDGSTYNNPCLADSAGVSLDHVGPCAPVCCDPAEEPGVGENSACIEGARCCTDGQWYCGLGVGPSSCIADGEVCRVCAGIAGIPCNEGEFCKLSLGECCCDFQGLCMPIPDACIEIFEPVCGCDGRTYPNSCFADTAGVSIDHEGECVDGVGGNGGGTGGG